MTRRNFASYVVIWQVMLISSIVILYIARGYNGDQLKTLLSIFAPFFGLFMGLAFRRIGDERKNSPVISNGKQIKRIFTIFSLIILALVVLCGLNPSWLSFSDLVTILLFVDGAFALYLGQLLAHLFQDPKIE